MNRFGFPIVAWLQRLPITLKMLLTTLTVVGVTWFLLDQWQSQQLESLFRSRLGEVVSRGAIENRMIFNRYLNNHHQAVQLLAAQHNFLDYLTLFASDPPKGGILFHHKPPIWLPPTSVLRTFIPLGYLLLLGPNGMVQEVYQGIPEPPPGGLLRPNPLLQKLSHNQVFITLVDDIPFLLTSETVANEQGRSQATLMLANPLNNLFLSNTPNGPQPFNGIIALLSSTPPQVIATNQPERIALGASLKELEKEYQIAAQVQFDYGSSDLQLNLATLISLEEFGSLTQSILRVERHQRAINAAILILSCLLVMIRITRNIEQITRNIVEFCRETLGGQPQAPQAIKQDELSVLREQFHHLTSEIIRTRDNLNYELQERCQAETEIRKLSLAVEQSPAAVMITDPEGLVVYVNPQFSRLTGYTREEVLGRNPRMLQAGDTPSSVYRDLWQTILTGRTWRGEMLNKRKNGEVYWEFNSISAIRSPDDQVTHYLAVKEDISQRIQLERNLQQAKEAAEAAIQVKNEFLANITHELRTPLNAIIGISQLMFDGDLGEVSRAQKKHLQSVLDSSSQLSRLIDNLLNLAKVDSDQFILEQSRFDLHGLVQQAMATISETARRKGLALSCRIQPNTWRETIGDPIRLRQVLLSLLRNAVKFTSQGSVSLVVENHPSLEAQAGTILFTIADTGIGIPDEKQETIFQAFTQVDSAANRQFGGSGLGLHLAKRLIELMGGRIWLESKVNQGTTVFFMVSMQLPATPIQAPANFRLSGLSALMVSRNPVDRMILKRLLNSMEIEVMESSDCRGLTEQLSGPGTTYAMLFLDCPRSLQEGLIELQRVRQAFPELPIMLSSVDPLGEQQEHWQSITGIYFLQKPLQRNQVHDAIFNAMAARNQVLTTVASA